MDSMSIFDWWLRPAEALSPAIYFLTQQSFKWPASIRKAYVLTWPVAAPLRLIAILLLLLLWIVFGGIGYSAAALNCVWLGERTPWQ